MILGIVIGVVIGFALGIAYCDPRRMGPQSRGESPPLY